MGGFKTKRFTISVGGAVWLLIVHASSLSLSQTVGGDKKVFFFLCHCCIKGCCTAHREKQVMFRKDFKQIK